MSPSTKSGDRLDDRQLDEPDHCISQGMSYAGYAWSRVV